MRLSAPRPPARVWIEVLRKIVPVLDEARVHDVILFGSQSMSVYMQRALASKDLDLIAPGVAINSLEKLADALAEMSSQRPTYDQYVGEYLGRRYPVSHIYLKHKDGFPFVLEFFDTFLGYPATKLAPFLSIKDKWGLSLQVPTPEAIIATRLAFRPPERITPTNAMRLNRFIRRTRKVDWSEVNAFIEEFKLRSLVLENIDALRSKHISITGTSKIT